MKNRRGLKMKVTRRILMTVCMGTSLIASALPVTAQPDLRITNLSTVNVITDGQSLIIGGSLGFSLANDGTTAVTTPFTVTVFEDRNLNSTYDPGTDVVLGVLQESTTLAAGSSVPRSVPLSGSVEFKGNLL